MSTALVSAFYDVDDVLYQNRINSHMTRSTVMNMEPPRKITGMTNNLTQHHQHHQQIPQQQSHQQQLSQQNQFRSRTGSISSTSSVQSDNSGYSFSNSSSMSMGSPSSTSSMISSLGGSMPSSPVDYRKQLDRSVSEPVGADSISRSREISKQDMVNNKANQNNINSSRYKTELCRPFEENGYCKYGDKCQFAHGAQELRSLNRHPKYKTELCRTYHTIGFCPYGPRCHFIHNDEERRLAQQHQQQAALQSLKQMGSQGPQQQTTTTTASPSHPQPQFSAGQPSQVVVPQHHHVAQAPPQQQPQQQPHHHSLQQHHLRPKSLNFNLLQMQRDSLGSTADSPPSSVTDSPTMSPTFFGEEMLMGSAFSPIPASAPASLQQNSAFPFQDLRVMPAVTGPVTSTQQQIVVPTPQQPAPPSMMSPLNVQTDQMVTLAAQLHALTIANQRNNNINTNDALLRESLDLLGVYAPPSPPESLASSTSSSNDSISGTCGSPLEVSRSLRLPIFSKLSCSDDSD